MSRGRRYTILLYHGVHGDDEELGLRNSSGKHIAASRFAAQMRHLAANRPLVSMRDIAAAYRGEAELPDGAVAVTFDDGFRNNHREAWPVLEEFKVPATVYVATGFIESRRMSWTDCLESALLRSRKKRLEIETRGGRRVWSLKEDRERIACLGEVKAICKAMLYAEKDALVERIIDALDVDPSEDHPIYAFMSWAELREMAASPLVDIGGHTVDHVALAKVAGDEMRRQIDRSVADLEAHLQKPATLFSYPEGQEDDYNAEVISHLRARGFDHCPTAIHGENLFPDTGAFHMRRIMVGFQNCPYPFAAL
jgi:peptidoglycan/xylan/chitin deacetylase (PgdA/CDA1 family)